MSIPDCPVIENLPNKKYNFNADSIHQEGCFLETLFLTKNCFFLKLMLPQLPATNHYRYSEKPYNL